MRNAKCVLTPDSGKHRMAGPIGLACLVLLLATSSALAAPNKLVISSAGLTVTGSGSAFTVTFPGNVDGIGASTNTTGASLTTTTSGAWYYGTITLSTTGLPGPGTTATINAWASSNTQFGGCAATGCPGTLLGIASPGIQVAGPITSSGTATINVGFFVSNQSGTGFSTTGSVTETLTFQMTSSTGATDSATLALKFTNQTAVNLALSASSIPIASVAFGNVNGLGAGTPSPGLTLLTPACGTPCQINPGVIYSYPYTITPTFSSFTSSTGTVTVQVTSNFTHSGDLVLMDSPAASFSSFSAIGVASPSTITSAAASATDISRFLGLEVKHVNGTGGTLGTGSDNATLTYTVTSP